MKNSNIPLNLQHPHWQAEKYLKSGDRVWRWQDGRRIESVVGSVVQTGRQEKVFNLILGDSKMFVAGGFLVRGKPPAEVVPAAGAAANSGHSAGHGKE